MIATKRHCSFAYSKNATSVICHSAIHRSTYRLSIAATQTVFRKNGNPYQRAFKNCRDAFKSFWYWSKQEQTAVDSWIEAIEVDASLQTADKLACVNSRPEWIFTSRKGRFGGTEVTATRQDGGLQLRIAADSWREAHYLTK